MKKNDNEKSILRSNALKRAGGVFCAPLFLAVVISILVFPTTGAALESCGEGNTTGKILIAYDSKHGSSSDYVGGMGEVLCNNGFQVDMGLFLEIDDISSYDGVIVGSPIYWGTLLPRLDIFLDTNRAALADPDRPVAFFLLSLFLDFNTFPPQVSPAAYWLFAYSTVLSQYPDIFPFYPLCPPFSGCVPYWVGLFPGKYIPRNAYPVEYIGMDLGGFGIPLDFVKPGIAGAWTQNLIDNGFFQ